jgi:hypothetical protein
MGGGEARGPKTVILKKKSSFRQTGDKQSASKVSALKMQILMQFHGPRPRIPYITEGVVWSSSDTR